MDALKTRLHDTKEAIVKLYTELESTEKKHADIVSERKAQSVKVIAAQKQFDLLELKFDRTTNELKKCEQSLDENIIAIEESKKATYGLQKKQADRDDNIVELEQKFTEVKEIVIVSQDRYNTVLHQLKEIEDKIEKTETCNDAKLKNILELEQLLNVYSTKLKSLDAAESQAKQSLQQTEDSIKQITESLKMATARARKAEEEAQWNQLALSQVEDELVDWKEKNTGLRSEIDRINVDLVA